MRIGRRSATAMIASGLFVGLSGCLGDTDQDDNEQGDDTDVNNEDSDVSPAEPAEFPADASCAVCNMKPAEHPPWNAQLVTDDDNQVFFCSPGCLLAYTVDPGRFGGDDTPLANVWVTEFESEDFIDGMEAVYLAVNDPNHIDDIMMMNPIPFSSESDAEDLRSRLNEEYDSGYTSEDIIGFSDFDHELAQRYRGDFFNNGGHNHD